MLTQFTKFIKEQYLFPTGKKVLLAVSGGVDSVVMTELVRRAGIPFAIAHCNFHLRPGDCDRDEAFVADLASRCGVEFHVKHFDTAVQAKLHSRSVEEQAREERLSFFFDLLEKYGYGCVATAHHRDDSIETVLLNLLRGTGLWGLHGIKPHGNRNVVHPMLCFSRKEIESFAEREGLPHVEDYTNATLEHQRNRVRHRLLPLMRELSPSFDKIMLENIRHFSEAEIVYREAIDCYRKNVLLPMHDVDGSYSISYATVEAMNPRRTIMYELLKEFDYSAAVVDDMLKAMKEQRGKLFYSSCHVVETARDAYHIYPLSCFSANQEPIELSDYGCLPDEITIGSRRLALSRESVTGSYDASQWRLPRTEACFDAEKLRFPLVFRPWKEGDTFVPYGMKGRRLVSDYMTDVKISRLQKQLQWVLCASDGRVLWLIGWRASNVAPVTSSTQQLLRFTVTR